MKKNLFHKIAKFKYRGLGYYLMRGVTNKTLRDMIIQWIISKRGKKFTVDQNSSSIFYDINNLQSRADEMRSNGFTVFENLLNSDILERILSHIATLDCIDPYRKHMGNVDLSKPAPETHIAHYSRNDLVKNKEILTIANDAGVLALAQDFLGTTPLISNINMWWSFGGRVQAEEAQLYHRDVDDWKFCKLFIYLTDVSSENGPHIYVKGSSGSPEFRKIRRYKDHEIESKFGKENVITFKKPKGSAFMVDTYGFHKGLLPRIGKRLLLQIEYSINPLSVEIYSPINNMNINLDKYINSLIIKND